MRRQIRALYIKHSIQKYHIQHAGRQLYLEGKQLYKVLKEYFL